MTYMELVQGMRNKAEFNSLRKTIHNFKWEILPLTKNISHRATVHIGNQRNQRGQTRLKSKRTHLWAAATEKHKQKSLFVYEIEIREAHRRLGFEVAGINMMKRLLENSSGAVSDKQ